MPQIHWVGRKDSFASMDDVADALTKTVESVFGLEGLNDVTFTAVEPWFTKNECDIQIEVRYSVGYEYAGRGRFNPSLATKKLLAEKIAEIMKRFGSDVSVSVWVVPYEKTVFRYVL